MVEMFLISALISFIFMTAIREKDKSPVDLDIKKNGDILSLIYTQDDGDIYQLNITPSKKDMNYSIERTRGKKKKSFPFNPGRVMDETFSNICKDGYEGKEGTEALKKYFNELDHVRQQMRDVISSEANDIERKEKNEE